MPMGSTPISTLPHSRESFLKKKKNIVKNRAGYMRVYVMDEIYVIFSKIQVKRWHLSFTESMQKLMWHVESS
jgi:hypothetical protein